VAFYACQARQRLEFSRAARPLTRIVLRAPWTPVGSGIMPAVETAFLLRYLMGGAEGARMIRQIDDKIDRSPGLANLHLVRRAAARYGVGPEAPGGGTGRSRADCMPRSLLRFLSLSR
jgi:hypothetical protein